MPGNGHTSRRSMLVPLTTTDASIGALDEDLQIQDIVKSWLKNSDWLPGSAVLNLQFLNARIPKGLCLDLGAGNSAMTHLLNDAFPATTFVACDDEEFGYQFYSQFRIPNGLTGENLRAFKEDRAYVLQKIMDTLRKKVDPITQGKSPFFNGRKSSGRADSSRTRVTTSGPIPAYVRGLAPKLPFKLGAFNSIVSIQTIEYIEDPVGYITSACEVLAPKGKFFFNVLSPYVAGPGPSFGPLMDWKVDLESKIAQTLKSEFLVSNPIAEYYQRILILAAMQGLTVERIGCYPRMPSAAGDPKRAHARSHYDDFVSRYEAIAGEEGISSLFADEAPSSIFFEFRRVGVDKVVIPAPENWVPYCDGTKTFKREKEKEDDKGFAMRADLVRGMDTTNVAKMNAMRGHSPGDFTVDVIPKSAMKPMKSLDR